MRFKVGDRVRVKTDVRPNGGKYGVVTGFEIRESAVWYSVYLDLMGNASVPHDKEFRGDELSSVGRPGKVAK